MRVTSEPGESPSRSFTANARRSQIVAAAIDTIAELGFPQASFARIAQRAGLSSTRLISYHFASKDELIGEVAREVFTSVEAFMAERMRDQHTARDMLCAYIRSNLEFTDAHRQQMKALMQIFLNGALDFDAADDVLIVSQAERILQHGQRTGEFRDFDTRVMGRTIQRAVEGLPFLLESDPDVDTDAYADELVTLFDLATRAA
ncbi:MAG: TetR family transcriptional regulator [Actinocatenispora sp.]